MKRLIVWIVVLAAVGAAGYAALVRTRAPEAPAYRSEALGKGDITASVTATGTLSAVTTVQVGSQVSGIIAKLYADFNSRVTKGQLLAELDPTNFLAAIEQRRADLAQTEVQMRNNEVTYDRQKRLLAQGLVAQGDYDAAKANFESSKAQVAQNRAALAQAETQLRYSKIASPIDGVVVDRQYDVGQTVAASFQAPTLFTIAQDLTRMQVQADVDQSDIGRVQVGQNAHFTVDAYPEKDFVGSISQIRLNATVSQNVITYPVIITVENPGERLRPKMTADISIEVAQKRDVLRVPNAALRFRPAEAAGAGPQAAQTAQAAGAAQNAPSGAASGAASGAPSGAPTGAPSASNAGGAAGSNGEGRRGMRGGNGGNGGAGGPGGGGFAGGAPGGGSGGPGGGNWKRRAAREQTVYVLGANNALRPVTIRTGITDGRYTEVVNGDLKPGDQVVIGTPTTKAESAGRMGGMGRF